MNHSAPKLLIVDDEPSMRELLEYMLSKEGYAISLAENGRTAVEMVADNTYDLILCDIRLGDITGDCVIDLDDYAVFEICLRISGPQEEPAFDDCLTYFDSDGDDDIDLVDFSLLTILIGADG